MLTSVLRRFVCFGSYLAKLGNITSGCTFAKLAKSLVEKLGAKDVEGAVDCALIEVQCYIEPVQACLDLFVNAERLSLSRGDIYWACLNRLQYVTNCFWSGLNLDVVNKTLDDAQLFFEKQGPNARLLFVTILQRTAKRLMGSTDLNSLNRYERLMQECTAPRQKISWQVHKRHCIFNILTRNELTIDSYQCEHHPSSGLSTTCTSLSCFAMATCRNAAPNS
jgi:hypothetical protein